MMPSPPFAVPPVTANYANTLQGAQAKAPPVQSAYKFFRASDGKTRVDSGNLSVISNPATAQSIVLDHVKKTATVQATPPPAPAVPGLPQMPPFAMPGMPASPQVPGVKVEDLGKTILQGHEVEGKRFVIPPATMPQAPALQAPGAPKPPQMPGMPAMPGAPQMPGMPAMPGAPAMPGMAGAPKLPQIPGMPAVPGMPAAPGIPGVAGAAQIPGVPAVPGAPKMPAMPGVPGAPKMPGAPAVPAAPQTPATTEIWSSTKMLLPMMSKTTSGFGQMTQVCHQAIPGEPPPSTFQIPQGYKVLGKSV
ncbi:MAG TPA: hypothetical protein VGL72_19445 [Bryobacteraceae bacterium]|jgi:hypothetical protein